jgi:hypothetical protein
VRRPYRGGSKLVYEDQPWVYERAAGAGPPIPPPREYVHTLSGLVDGLIGSSFVIYTISDTTDVNPDPEAAPGTWDHFTAVAPPWLTFWAVLRPDVFGDN